MEVSDVDFIRSSGTCTLTLRNAHRSIPWAVSVGLGGEQFVLAYKLPNLVCCCVPLDHVQELAMFLDSDLNTLENVGKVGVPAHLKTLPRDTQQFDQIGIGATFIERCVEGFIQGSIRAEIARLYGTKPRYTALPQVSQVLAIYSSTA